MSQPRMNSTKNSVETYELIENRERVMAIWEKLPEFQYGLFQEEDNDPGVQKIKKDVTMLENGAKYDGEWNKATN